MGNITFANRLLEADWDDALRAWRCPILEVPGAKVRDIVVDGTRVDRAQYEVLADQAMVHWIVGDRPARIAVIVELTQSLSLGAETDKWKRLAIVLPVFATIASALISTAGTYFLASSSMPYPKSRSLSGPPPTDKPSVPKSASPINADTEFFLMMPRGDKVCLTWKGQKGDEPYRDALKRSNISVVDFHQGIKIAYGALVNKRPDTIGFIPFFGSDGKILGKCESVTNSGPANNSQYEEFQLFQHGREFQILFSPLNRTLPAIPSETIGVDWDKVRSGLRMAFKALYHNKDFEFGAVNVLTSGDGTWEYRLAFRPV